GLRRLTGSLATSCPASLPGTPASTSAGADSSLSRRPPVRSTSSSGGPPLGGTYGTGSTTHRYSPSSLTLTPGDTSAIDSVNERGSTASPSSPVSVQHGTTSRVLGRWASTPRQLSGPSGCRTRLLAWCAPPNMRTCTSHWPGRSGSPCAAA